MPSDLDPTASSWGTKDMLPATGEIGEAVDFAQGVANNTGYNFYYPKLLDANHAGGTTEDDGGASSVTMGGRAYMLAGTYLAHAAVNWDINDEGTVHVNGTDILSHNQGASGWVDSGNGTEVIVAASGWVSYYYRITEAVGGFKSTLSAGMITAQQKS